MSKRGSKNEVNNWWGTILGALAGLGVLIVVSVYNPSQGYLALSGYQVDWVMLPVMFFGFLCLVAGFDFQETRKTLSDFLKALGVTILVGGLILIVVYPMVMEWVGQLKRWALWAMIIGMFI